MFDNLNLLIYVENEVATQSILQFYDISSNFIRPYFQGQYLPKENTTARKGIYIEIAVQRPILYLIIHYNKLFYYEIQTIDISDRGNAFETAKIVYN